MKINIIGGGPAGLYFALLMKQSDAVHDITLWERNAPDATFGWGVVFSGQTLSHLQAADAPTHAAITAQFARWDNVDVVHRGQKVTIRGNSFLGIGRLALLQILQARCRELGVTLRFQADISDIAALEKCDLLIAADGVNSATRQRYAAQFQPNLDLRPNRYIGYGTRQLFHGLTLTFCQNEAGTFSAHSYKFNDTTSTFIVECDAATWQAAGLAEMDDTATRNYLEKVFAADLGGHELLSNNSKWVQFPYLRNEHWHYRNIALLGDALHTAHFSIGSGTKLALEDAIALHTCCQQTDGVNDALALFEKLRRPVIEAYQAAAWESMLWFENARDHMHLEPMELAYRLMTRSGTIDRERLRRRDPQFVAEYEKIAKVQPAAT